MTHTCGDFQNRLPSAAKTRATAAPATMKAMTTFTSTAKSKEGRTQQRPAPALHPHSSDRGSTHRRSKQQSSGDRAGMIGWPAPQMAG